MCATLQGFGLRGNPKIRPVPYTAADERYASMQYRRCGRSGLQLPAISLGLWHNFGGDRQLEMARAILLRAFDNPLHNNHHSYKIGTRCI
jgi:hypothetical protein